jgi:hypothetical protein
MGPPSPVIPFPQPSERILGDESTDHKGVAMVMSRKGAIRLVTGALLVFGYALIFKAPSGTSRVHRIPATECSALTREHLLTLIREAQREASSSVKGSTAR